MSDDLLLPAGARLVHIGPQKTGTTAIQTAMFDSRDEMAQQGVAYPGAARRPRRAGWALGLPGGPQGGVPIEEWERFAAEVRDAGQPRVCVSDENYARAELPVAERIVGDLGGDAVHVVAVARRLDKYLPSQWQERVKAGMPDSFEDWLRRIFADGGGRDRERWNVWMGHDVEALVDRWTGIVGAERFTLVIADDGDRNQLADVFQRLLGLRPGTLQAKGTAGQTNQSMSWSETELLREVTRLARARAWDRVDRVALSHAVVRGLRSTGRSAPGPRAAVLPEWAFERAREISERRIAALSSLPVRVVGDPEHLRVTGAAEPPADPESLRLPVDLASAAVMAAAGKRSQGSRPPAPAPDLGAYRSRELLRAVAGRAWSRLR